MQIKMTLFCLIPIGRTATKRGNYLRAVLIIALLHSWGLSAALSQGKLQKTYSYNSIGQLGIDSMPFKLYYIVDSARTIVYKSRKYYQFTLSTDSSRFIGYISLNKQQDCINFISKRYNTSNDLPRRMRTGTPLFDFRNGRTSMLYYMGFLGDAIRIRSSRIKSSDGEELYSMTLAYYGPIVSESVYVYNLVFRKGAIFPEYITFSDPFLGKIKRMAD